VRAGLAAAAFSVSQGSLSADHENKRQRTEKTYEGHPAFSFEWVRHLSSFSFD
jgi:hypothetical protein